MTSRNVVPSFLLGRRGRKLTLVIHIVSAGAWIGIDVIAGVLVVAGWFTSDLTTQGVAYIALGTYTVVPMLTSGIICLASGLLLGLGTRYGLFRYWWVAVKLTMNVILCVLIVVLLRPGMPEIIDHGRSLITASRSDLDVSTLFFPPAVSLTALMTATLLAVFRPFGRIKASEAE